VQTADCAPVVLCGDGPGGPVVGVAHAGWRGLYDGVVEQTVAEMHELGATALVAELGPCISPAAYEFGADELTRMALRFGPDVVATTSEGRPALDLRAAVAAVLDVLDVDLVGGPPPCTATDPGWFSWRARHDTGRQTSAVWIEPEP
jgi:copper oxidase (laccase) domain-containing protein